jgi:hypothetical protein
MVWHVVPKSVDIGELGLGIEADSAEAAAALAVAGPYAEYAGQPMVVRWDLRYDRQGELLCCRLTEVRVKVAAPVAAPIARPEPAVEAPVPAVSAVPAQA